MREGEPPSGIEQPPEPEGQIELNADEWDLVRASVDDYLRSYLEADFTWWESDDDRPVRLRALLDKLTGGIRFPRSDPAHHWWPGRDIGRFLGVHPRLRHHRLYGLGVRFNIEGGADHPWARLDLYPERRTTTQCVD